MAQKRGNGNGGGVQDAMLDVLKAIHESVVEVRGELQGVRGELRQLKDETHAGFAEVRGRLDNIRDFAGEHYRALEERVTRLEAKGS
jgi:hypothetical protein